LKRLLGGDGAAIFGGGIGKAAVITGAGAKLTRDVYVGGVGSAGKNNDEAGILAGSRAGEAGSSEYVLIPGPTRSDGVTGLVPVVFLLFEPLFDCVSVRLDATLFAVLLLLLLERPECPECPDPGLEAPELFNSSE